MNIWVFLFAALLLARSACAAEQPVELDESLNETVLMLPTRGNPTVHLETTIYKPEGNGPFPVVLINHGKAFGDPRLQTRYRPAVAARYFLQRGYAVVAPMRQGFSNSEGKYIGSRCNAQSNGELQAEDVKSALDYVVAQAWANPNQLLVLGQSVGGWVTLAFGKTNYPGVKGLVNFAGGLRNERCAGWERALAVAAAHYAEGTSAPSLWFYGDNDSYFSKPTYQAMFDDYVAAGGNARLIAFGAFGTDAHSMFAASAGAKIWQPEVTAFLRAIGMPSAQLPIYAKLGLPNLMKTPPKTNFAPLEDETKVPHLNDIGRLGYKAYLTKKPPRAFAVAPTGVWGMAQGGEDPLKQALDNCNYFAIGQCRLYAVDDFVVWRSE